MGDEATAEKQSNPETEREPRPALDDAQLTRLRETLIAAYPDVVPELVAGADFDTLLASVAPAREAYQRVREVTAREALGSVPRGGATSAVDAALLAGLGPEAKISAAMRGR